MSLPVPAIVCAAAANRRRDKTGDACAGRCTVALAMDEDDQMPDLIVGNWRDGVPPLVGARLFKGPDAGYWEVDRSLDREKMARGRTHRISVEDTYCVQSM